MAEYKTPKKTKQTVEVDIDGRTVKFTKPKDAVLVLPMIDGGDANAQVKALFDWVGQGLNKKDEAWLESRLRDPSDDFDLSDLNAIVELITGELSSVPPT